MQNKNIRSLNGEILRHNAMLIRWKGAQESIFQERREKVRRLKRCQTSWRDNFANRKPLLYVHSVAGGNVEHSLTVAAMAGAALVRNNHAVQRTPFGVFARKQEYEKW